MVDAEPGDPMIAIVDYGMSNLRSVRNALELLGANVVTATAPPQLAGATKIVLPGVGAFGDAMANLRAGGWVEALDAEVRKNKKPFLGICLGMQLLAERGTEHGDHQGLGWIPGSVVRLARPNEVRIPHIGWNELKLKNRGGVLADVPPGSCFYFVHSYALEPSDPTIVSGTCEYGGSDFVASIEYENISAVQFHPEKSQKSGLAILKRFLAS
jgi:glutamine amidotransferase